ncbi:MAG: T9SS type A sorting domain-containing protein [Flavobacterium sp.]
MKKITFTLLAFIATSAAFSQGIRALDGSEHYFRYATIYDWDCCLFGPGIDDGQPYNYLVDGHFKVSYDATGQGTIVESTGNYASSYPVGSNYNQDFGYSSNPTYKSLTYNDQCCNADGDKIYVELSDEILLSTLELQKPEMTAIAYPNPYSKSFNLVVNNPAESTIRLKVYDMIGKLIEELEMKPNQIPVIQIGNLYSAGVYCIVLCQGKEVKTLKVIKE